MHNNKNPYDGNLHKRLKIREQKISLVQEKIMEKRRSHDELKLKLQRKREHQCVMTQQKNWKTMYNIVKLPDGTLRPPDKTNNIRTYSNMDKNLWEGGEKGEVLRGWFLQHATNIQMDHYDPEKSGFLVKRSTPMPPSTPNVYTLDPNRDTLGNRRQYAIPDLPAGYR